MISVSFKYLSFRLAAKTTFAPFSARALATASPIPLDAPVTMATLPPRDLGPRKKDQMQLVTVATD